MYGFAESYPENIFDAVEIASDLLLKVFKQQLSTKEQEKADKKWAFLEELVTIFLQYVLPVFAP